MLMIFCTIQSERLRRKGKTPINHARINRKKLAEQQRLNRLDQQIKEEDGRRRARQEGRKPRRFRKTPSKIEEARVRTCNFIIPSRLPKKRTLENRTIVQHLVVPFLFLWFYFFLPLKFYHMTHAQKKYETKKKFTYLKRSPKKSLIIHTPPKSIRTEARLENPASSSNVQTSGG